MKIKVREPTYTMGLTVALVAALAITRGERTR